MSRLTKQVSPAWIVITILCSIAAVYIATSLISSGTPLHPYDYPGAVVFIFLIGLVVWIRRYGVTVENDRTPRGILHSKLVYTLVLITVLLILWVGVVFHESMK